MKKMGQLLWITGYFGSGKSALVNEAIEIVPNLKYLKTFTTRKPRENEINSKSSEYLFVTKKEYAARRLRSKRWDHTVINDDY